MSRQLWLWTCIASVALMFVVSLIWRPLLPIDETRYLTVAWEMWNGGHWLIPQLNGADYAHKPPLLFWLIHLGWMVFGVNEWWPRLIAPLCTLISVLALERLAARLWPTRPLAGRIGTLLFLTGTFVSLYLTAVMFDMLLLACISLGWLFLHRGVCGGRWRDWMLFGLATGLALLSKGPVALLYLLPTLLTVRLWADSGRSPIQGRKLVVGWLIALAVPAIWLALVVASHDTSYLRVLLIDQTLDRVHGELGHPRAWFWYLPRLPLLALPWLLWPTAWAALARLRTLHTERGLRMPLLSVAISFVLLCLISGKQVHYLIPLLALASLAMGRLLSDGDFHPGVRAMAGPALLLGGTLGLVAIIGRVDPSSLPHDLPVLPLWAVVATAMLGLWLLATRRISSVAAVRRVALASVAFNAILLASVFVTLGADYDPGRVATVVRQQQDKGHAVAIVGSYHGEFGFLGRLQKPLTRLELEQLPEWFEAHPDGVLLARASRPLGNAHVVRMSVQPSPGGALAIYQGPDAKESHAAVVIDINTPQGPRSTRVDEHPQPVLNTALPPPL